MAKRKRSVRPVRPVSSPPKRRNGAARSRNTAKKGTSRASRALAESTWNHLPPAKRKGKTKAAFVARSIASRASWAERKTPIRIKVKIAKAKLKFATERAERKHARTLKPRAKLHEDFREYQASVRYTKKHGASTGHSGTLQGSVFAPKGTPAHELRQALIDHIKQKTPKFTVSAIEWRRRIR